MSLVELGLVRRALILSTVVLVVMAGLGLATLVAPARAQDARGQLDEARARIEELEDEIDRAEAAAEDADSELEEAERVLRQAEAVVNEVAARVDHQRDAVADAERRYEQVVAEAEVVEAAFADRVAQIYKEGPALTFEALLASEQADDALDRSLFLQQLSADDRVDLDLLEATRTRVSAERERFEREQARLEGLLAEEREFLAEVEQLRERRALKAAATREHLHELEDEHDDLRADQEALEELIREREQAARDRGMPTPGAPSSDASPRRASTGSASSSGYVWPICAPVTSEFGRRWGRMHEGIDLGAPTGTPIGASKAGTVIHAGWQGGYGQMVLVSHGDGVVTAYAHMSRIGTSSGASVSRGDTLGYVGSTGNSTGPHLHLETRVNGSAVNPRQYLAGGPC